MRAGDVAAAVQFADEYGVMFLAVMRDGPHRLGKVCLDESLPTLREAFREAAEAGHFKRAQSDTELWAPLMRALARGAVVRSRRTGERLR